MREETWNIGIIEGITEKVIEGAIEAWFLQKYLQPRTNII